MTTDREPNPESKVERAKKQSRFLRGTIDEVLDSDAPRFEHDNAQLLKFHGTYQQYDRDARSSGGQSRGERSYQFMVRCRIPGGQLTAAQYLTLAALTDELSDGTLRITSRQGLQFHGVLKHNLRATIARINETLITTLGACGDVSRNVMMCPAPTANGLQAAVVEFGNRIATALAPASRAYHELWLDGEPVESNAEQEPFYGPQYLPRKFKTAIAMPGDNCVDLYTNDVGLLPIVESNGVRGANMLVGGGLGLTHTKADTFARLASPLGFVDAEHVIEAVRTVAAIFRDHGNRADRRHARLKYLIEERGLEWFREEFEHRFPGKLQSWVETGPLHGHDHIGRHDLAAENCYYGLAVENGRIRDADGHPLRSAIRAIADELSPGIRLTPQQNLLFTNLAPAAVARLEAILDTHGVPRAGATSPVRRASLACPAFPTCGLAIAESERAMPELLDQLEAELAALGLADEPITIRMTGCPNGCARPYTADVAFVGRADCKYNVYLGGRSAGDRLADLFAELVPFENLLATVRPLLHEWRDRRQPGEGFGDYYHRAHHQGPPRALLTGAKLPAPSDPPEEPE